MKTPELAGLQLFGHGLIDLAIGVSMYVVGTAMLLAAFAAWVVLEFALLG